MFQPRERANFFDLVSESGPPRQGQSTLATLAALAPFLLGNQKGSTSEARAPKAAPTVEQREAIKKLTQTEKKALKKGNQGLVKVCQHYHQVAV